MTSPTTFVERWTFNDSSRIMWMPMTKGIVRSIAATVAAVGALVLFAPRANAWVCDTTSTGGCAGATGLSSCGGGCGTCSAISGVLCKCKSGPATCGGGSTCNPTRTCAVSSTGEGSCPAPPGSGTKCDADSNPCTDDNCNGSGGCSVGFDYTGSCSSHKGECNDIAAPYCKVSGGSILCDDRFKADGTPCSIGECKSGTCVKTGDPPPTDSGPPPGDSGGSDTSPPPGDAPAGSDTSTLFPVDDGGGGPGKDSGSGANDIEGSPASCGCSTIGAGAFDVSALAFGVSVLFAARIRRRRTR